MVILWYQLVRLCGREMWDREKEHICLIHLIINPTKFINVGSMHFIYIFKYINLPSKQACVLNTCPIYIMCKPFMAVGSLRSFYDLNHWLVVIESAPLMGYESPSFPGLLKAVTVADVGVPIFWSCFLCSGRTQLVWSADMQPRVRTTWTRPAGADTGQVRTKSEKKNGKEQPSNSFYLPLKSNYFQVVFVIKLNLKSFHF